MKKHRTQPQYYLESQQQILKPGGFVAWKLNATIENLFKSLSAANSMEGNINIPRILHVLSAKAAFNCRAIA